VIRLPDFLQVIIGHPMIAQWMIACLVFSLFLAIAVWRADVLLRVSGRQTRHLWIGGLLIAVAWTGLAPTLFTTQEPTLTSQLVAPVTMLQPVTVEPTARDIQQPAGTGTVLLAGWCVVSALLVIRLLVAVAYLLRLRRTASRATVDGYDVLVTENVGPAVIGGQRGEILIPSWLLEFEPALRALVFRHEEEHRSARDPLLLWSSLVITTLLPWNLPLWWMANRLRLSLEVDCDARTLTGETDRRRYAQLLLLIAQKHTHVPFASTLAGRESGLSHRISIMLKAPSRISKTSMTLSALVMVAFVAAACSTRIASNLTSPAPEREVAAKPAVTVAAVDSTIAVVAVPGQAIKSPAGEKPAFDFQTDVPAKVLPGFAPTFPEDLRAAGASGTVLVQVVVRPDSAADMNTFKILTSDNPAFNVSVRESIARMRFSPAQVNGRSVSQLMQLPFTFSSGKVDAEVRPAVLPRTPATRPADIRVQGVNIGGTAAPTRSPAVRNPDQPYFDFQVQTPAMAIPGTATPQYPEDLRQRNIEGNVLVQFVVDAEGVPNVATFKVLKSNDAAFSDAVLAVLPNMRFTPAQLSDGTKVKQLMQLPFGFKVNR
jgi:TonB family protein